MGVGAEVNDPPGAKRVAGVQEGIVPEPSIPCDGIHNQVGVETRQLQQECCGRILLTRIGRQKVVEQHEAEAAVWICELERQAAIPVT
jgi:hypothetical protein